MDIMEVHKGISYETMNTERKWIINLHSPDEDAPEITGEPAYWRYVIYDDEDIIVATDFYNKHREDTLAFACRIIEELEAEGRYVLTTDDMDRITESLNPVGQ